MQVAQFEYTILVYNEILCLCFEMKLAFKRSALDETDTVARNRFAMYGA